MASAFSPLLMHYNSAIFEISATILATTIVLFFTLILIPIQQCANHYSPSLLNYFKRDRVAIECMLLLLLSMFFNIYTLLIPTSLGIHGVISVMLLAFSFIGIIWMIFHIIKMLSPAEYLFPKIKNDCIKTLERGLSKKTELTLQEKIVQLEDQMKQALLVAEQGDPKEEKWAVPTQVIDSMFEKMLPLKSIAMKLISTSDYEVFEKLIQNIKSISLAYFHKRRDYKSFHDPFLFSLSETFADILKMAESCSNVYFTRILFTAIKDIAVGSLAVDVLGSKSGYNHLAQPLCNILRERAEVGILRRDRDRAYDATSDLGDVGSALASKGFGHSAAEVASDLGEIAQICAAANDTITLVPVRKSLAEIFFDLIWNRKLYPNYDTPYKEMLEVYQLMLDIPVHAGTPLGTGDPLFAWNANLSQDRSLSTLVYAALFSRNNDDNVVEYNLDVVGDIVEFIEKHHDKNSTNTAHFTNHIYQIGLWLLAFIDTEITLEMILSQQAMTPTDKNKEKAKCILFNILSYLTNTYFDNLEGKRKNANNGWLLPYSLSLLYLSMHLNNAHNLDLTKGLDLILEELDKRLNSLQCELDWTACQSIRIFCGYLDKTGRRQTVQKILAIVNTKSQEYGSIHSPYLVDRIKRPIVTFDSNLFARFDEEIFGQNLKNRSGFEA